MIQGKAISMIALTLISSGTIADWQIIGSNGREFVMFVNPEAVSRNGVIVTMPQMVTYGDSRPARVAGYVYRSELSRVEYDCAGRRTRVVATDQIAGEMAVGNVVFRDANHAIGWESVPIRTNIEIAWKLACEKP